MNKKPVVDVLIIDDDPEFSKFVVGVAESVGLSVVSLKSSLDFKAEFEAHYPRVVVLDIAMPGVDGVQIAQWLGQQHTQQGWTGRVILVTGYGVDFIRLCSSIAALSGLDKVHGLSKPIEHGALALALLGDGDGKSGHEPSGGPRAARGSTC